MSTFFYYRYYTSSFFIFISLHPLPYSNTDPTLTSTLIVIYTLPHLQSNSYIHPHQHFHPHLHLNLTFIRTSTQIS